MYVFQGYLQGCSSRERITPDDDTSCLIKHVFGKLKYSQHDKCSRKCLRLPHWLSVSLQIFYTSNILTHFHEFQALAAWKSVLNMQPCCRISIMKIIYSYDFSSVQSKFSTWNASYKLDVWRKNELCL